MEHTSSTAERREDIVHGMITANVGVIMKCGLGGDGP